MISKHLELQLEKKELIDQYGAMAFLSPRLWKIKHYLEALDYYFSKRKVL